MHNIKHQHRTRLMVFAIIFALIVTSAAWSVPTTDAATSDFIVMFGKVGGTTNDFNSSIKIDMDGNLVSSFLMGTGISSLEVDPVNNKVYWSASNVLYRADVNDTNGSTIETITPNDVSLISSLTFDPVNEVMYFLGRFNATGTTNKIIALDVSNDSITSFDQDPQTPLSSMEVDYVNNRIYWTYQTEVYGMDIGGGNPQATTLTLPNGATAISVSDLSLDPVNEDMYVRAFIEESGGNRSTGISKVDLNGINANTYFLTSSNAQQIEVNPNNGKIYWAVSALYRSNLDGSNQEQLTVSGAESLGNNIALGFTLDESPVITLTGASEVSIPQGGTYTELGATATDAEDGNISQSIVIDSSAVNVNVPGSYTVTYNVTDSTGNAAKEVTRTVIVQPLVNITVDDGDVSEEGSNGGSFTVNNSGSSTITATLTLSGTATLTTDYALTGGTVNNSTVTVSLAAGDNTIEVTSIVDDEDVEGSETVILTVDAGQDYTVGTNNTATITISDNDVIAPELTTDPAQNATGVKKDANLTLNFSEAVTINTAGVTFTCGGNAVDVTAPTFTSTQVVIDPTSNLPFETNCVLSIPTANVVDADSNPLIDNDGINAEDGVYQYTFTTEVPPQITANFPENDATDVALDTAPTITMNEPIIGVKDGITIICNPGNVSVAFSGVLTTNGSTLYTMTPLSDLPGESTCTVSIPVANGTDTDGNAVVDNQGANDGVYAFSFDTVGIPPEITATDPLPNATGVSKDAAITLTLSELTPTVNSLPTLTCDTSGVQTYTVAVNTSSGVQAVFTPDAALPFGETCTLAITVADILDANGNTLLDTDGNADGNYNLSFTVEEAPAVISSVPAENAIGVSVDTDITLTTNEQMFATGNGQITLDCGGDSLDTSLSVPNVTTYVLSPNAPLPSGAACTLTIPVTAARDADGNLLAGNDGDNYVLSFNTAGAGAPAVEGAPMIEGTE